MLKFNVSPAAILIGSGLTTLGWSLALPKLATAGLASAAPMLTSGALAMGAVQLIVFTIIMVAITQMIINALEQRSSAPGRAMTGH